MSYYTNNNKGSSSEDRRHSNAHKSRLHQFITPLMNVTQPGLWSCVHFHIFFPLLYSSLFSDDSILPPWHSGLYLGSTIYYLQHTKQQTSELIIKQNESPRGDTPPPRSRSSSAARRCRARGAATTAADVTTK